MIQKRFQVALLILGLLLATMIPNIQFTQAATKLTPKPTQDGFFTENKGQWDPAFQFVGSTSFGKVTFTSDAILYQMIKSDSKTSQSQTIKLSFVNPDTPTIKGYDVLPHYNNYFLGNDPKKWASYCRNFARVTYEDVWEGIDLAYFFTPEGLKYEYYVAPEANIKNLQIRVEGATLANLENTLQLTNQLGTIQDANLLVFDQVTNQALPCRFALKDQKISFDGIPEKRNNTIVIDPLVYSTYLGSTDLDVADGITVDGAGFTYVTGITYSSGFPTTSGAFSASYSSIGDCYITKLSTDGTSLVFSTFLGGSGIDTGYAIKVDASGNTYITGRTNSADFPTTPGAFDTTFNSTDCFVTKLNPSGSSLLYSTFLGGSGDETGNSIALDAGGNTFIAGNTTSINFPTTPGAVIPTPSYTFVTKLNPSGTALVYSTYLGGTGGEAGKGIVVDASGYAYITGYTWSADFPTTPGAFNTTFSGNADSFVTKLNPDGTGFMYSTYLGGSGDTYASGIAIDAAGNAYVTGLTWCTDYPTTPGAYDRICTSDDCFVTKLNPSGSALVYSTFLGGSRIEYGNAIMVDAASNAYVTGYTQSGDYPTTPDAFDTSYSGTTDCFVAKFDPAGATLLYSTYLGGSLYDSGLDMALDAGGTTYICGYTRSPNYPTTQGAYDTMYSGNADGFVTKLSTSTVESTLTGTLTYNIVHLAWTVKNPDNLTIQGYRIYRADTSNNIYELLGFVEGTSQPVYADTTGNIGKTYSYYVVVLDSYSLQLARSNTITLGPIQAVPQPLLELSIWTNKTEFCTGEDVLYKVTIFNQSYGAATLSSLSVSFPRDIQYLSCDQYRGETQPSGLVNFFLGTIPGNSSVTFQINAAVAGTVPFERSTATLFTVTCLEKSTDQTTINLALKRCGGGSPVLEIKAYYQNTLLDPISGEIYLPQTEELLMNVELSGFMTPLSYEIIWGDGSTDKMEKQTETKYALKHKFTSKGKMVIQIKATDATGRSKSVALSLVVR